jgi:PAS domain S-box-containing protein
VEAQQPLGVLVLRIDPSTYLFPLLSQWPVPSDSAETILVRRDGKDVLFLNPLRFDPEAALSLRLPLTNTNNLAVRAVLGQTGIVEGLVYRGIQAIADIRPVPGTEWYLVSKIDMVEFLAPLRSRMWLTLGMVVLLTLASGVGLLTLWRGQQNRFYRERFRTLEELHTSEDKFKKAFKTSPDSITITRATDGNYVSANQAHEKILGFTEAEILGKTSVELGIWVHEEDRKKIVSDLRAKGHVDNFEALFRAKNGNLVEGSMSAALVDIEGVPHILSTTRDISERKQAEKLILESKRLLQQLVDGAQSLIYLVDTEGRFILVNKQLADLFGLPIDEVIGKSREAFLPEEIAHSHRANDLEVIASRKMRVFEEEDPQKEGVKTYFSTKFPVLNSDGVIYAIGGISTDITDRKKIQAKLAEQLDELKRWQVVMMGREERIMELKEEVNRLLTENGKSKRYGKTELDDDNKPG